jgi:cytoskeletal protein CcmA (bactofilin family)
MNSKSETKLERKCRIVRDITNVEFVVKKGILNSTKICFKGDLLRKDREKINKNLKKGKFNMIWGEKDSCVIIK